MIELVYIAILAVIILPFLGVSLIVWPKHYSSQPLGIFIMVVWVFVLAFVYRFITDYKCPSC